MNTLMWTELYRPKVLADYVFRDKAQKQSIEKWVADGIIPHLLFSGSPGVGKTTLSQALARALGLQFRRVQFTSDLLPAGTCAPS